MVKYTKNELRLLPKIYKIDIASPQVKYLGIFLFQFQEVIYLHVTRRTEISLVYMYTFEHISQYICFESEVNS